MDWKALALCRGRDPNIWFPDHDRWGETRAKRICLQCPVRFQCLDVGLATNSVGIWGGTTERERKLIRDRYVRPSKALDGAFGGV